MGTRIPLDPEEIKRRQLQEKLKLSCAEIGLSVRTTNCLDEQGITTVADLLQRKRADLLITRPLPSLTAIPYQYQTPFLRRVLLGGQAVTE